MARYIDADKAKEKKVYSVERHEHVIPVAEIDWLPTADVAPRAEWISVDDKKPEDVYGKDREKITVLVCTKSGKVSASTRCARYSYDYGQNTWVRTGEYEWSGGKKVTHWQPMPDPPHQQDDRQERI